MVTKIFDAKPHPLQHFISITIVSGIVPIGAKIIDAKVAIYYSYSAILLLFHAARFYDPYIDYISHTYY